MSEFIGRTMKEDPLSDDEDIFNIANKVQKMVKDPTLFADIKPQDGFTSPTEDRKIKEKWFKWGRTGFELGSMLNWACRGWYLASLIRITKSNAKNDMVAPSLAEAEAILAKHGFVEAELAVI